MGYDRTLDREPPEGYEYDPITGQLRLIDQSPIIGGASGPITDWNTDPRVQPPPGAQAPPGTHWDPHMANFVPDAHENPIVQPTPQPTPGPASTTQTAAAPTYGASGPTFNAPGYTPPPAFSYSSFVAPDPSQLDKDPMYVDTLRREQDAIQRSATARGVLNTGGTIDELLRNAKDVASTGYANIFNRDLSTYQTNRTNALDQYNTNYSTQFKDPYQYKYMGAQDAYNSNQHNYDLSQQYGWYQNLFDWQKQQDLFNDKYKLLSL